MTKLTADKITTGTEIVYQAPDRAFQTERDYYEPVRGTVVDVEDRTIHSGPDSSWEKTVVILETEEGEREVTNIENLIGETDYRVGVIPTDNTDEDGAEKEVVADGGSETVENDDEPLAETDDERQAIRDELEGTRVNILTWNGGEPAVVLVDREAPTEYPNEGEQLVLIDWDPESGYAISLAEGETVGWELTDELVETTDTRERAAELAVEQFE